MSNLSKRLRDLEVKRTDASGFVPHSPQWLNYWREVLRLLWAGHRSPDLPRIPVEAYRAVVLGRHSGKGRPAAGEEGVRSASRS
jgi:hypothetical protein